MVGTIRCEIRLWEDGLESHTGKDRGWLELKRSVLKVPTFLELCNKEESLCK